MAYTVNLVVIKIQNGTLGFLVGIFRQRKFSQGNFSLPKLVIVVVQ